MASSTKKLKAGNGIAEPEVLARPSSSKKIKSKKVIPVVDKKLNGNHKKVNGTNGHGKKLNVSGKKAKSKGHISNDLVIESAPSSSLDSTELLNILLEVKNGNFDVKMPINKVGISGKVCDTLNDIILINRKLIREFSKARQTVGKEGKLNQRILLNDAQGEWKNGVEDLNALISDLVYPIREIDRVISAVAKGNL
ncbi:MAG: hypothetical protein ACXVO9_09125, partial [Bacteroidia bacterium]